MPFVHKLLNASEYLVSPRRSKYRLQKAKVEKFLLIVANSCLALGILSGI